MDYWHRWMSFFSNKMVSFHGRDGYFSKLCWAFIPSHIEFKFDDLIFFKLDDMLEIS